MKKVSELIAEAQAALVEAQALLQGSSLGPPKPAPPYVRPSLKGLTVYVNAGHGATDPKTGRYMTFPQDGKFYRFTDHGNFEAREGDFNRIFARNISEKLARFGADVVTIHHEISDRSNKLRTTNANKHYSQAGRPPALWLGLHSNAMGIQAAGPSIDVRGTFTFCHSTSSPGHGYAQAIGEYLAPLGLYRGIRTDIPYHELTWTAMPALIIENRFFTNWLDVQELRDPIYQEKFSASVVDGIIQEYTKTRKMV